MKNWIIGALITWIVYHAHFWVRGDVAQEVSLAAGLFVVITMMVWAADWKMEEIKEIGRRKDGGMVHMVRQGIGGNQGERKEKMRGHRETL